MRTVTTSTDVFKFDELSKEVQEKVIEKFRENYLDYDWWDGVYEDFISICSILGIETDHKKIFFSGFSSQGDGACFEGSYQYKKGSVKEIKSYAPKDKKLHQIALELSKIQRTAFYKLRLDVKHQGFYHHENCTVFNIERNDYCDVTKGQEDGLIEVFKDLMRWLYKTLNAEYDYLQSDESIKETIKCNDYEFTKEGKRFH